MRNDDRKTFPVVAFIVYGENAGVRDNTINRGEIFQKFLLEKYR